MIKPKHPPTPLTERIAAMNLTQPTAPPLIVDLHGLKLAFQTPDPPLRERFELVYGHLPRVDGSESDIFVGWHIHKLPMAPPPPPPDTVTLMSSKQKPSVVIG